jgi:hypothetical protein
MAADRRAQGRVGSQQQGVAKRPSCLQETSSAQPQWLVHIGFLCAPQWLDKEQVFLNSLHERKIFTSNFVPSYLRIYSRHVTVSDHLNTTLSSSMSVSQPTSNLPLDLKGWVVKSDREVCTRISIFYSHKLPPHQRRMIKYQKHVLPEEVCIFSVHSNELNRLRN